MSKVWSHFFDNLQKINQAKEAATSESSSAFWAKHRISPIVVSENDALEIVKKYSGCAIETLSALAEQFIPHIFYSCKKEDAYSIAEARSMIESFSYMPGDKMALFVIHHFDAASPEVYNAFLKTLEDGVDGGVFVLVCNSIAPLLDTILSRVMILSFGTENTEEDQIFLPIIQKCIAQNPVFLKEIFQTQIQDRGEVRDFIQLFVQEMHRNHKFTDSQVFEELIGATYGKAISTRNLLDACIFEYMMNNKK